MPMIIEKGRKARYENDRVYTFHVDVSKIGGEPRASAEKLLSGHAHQLLAIYVQTLLELARRFGKNCLLYSCR